MTKGITVKRQFHVRRGRSNRRQVRPGAMTTVSGGVPRIARLMALAIQFDRIIREDVVRDQAELARLGKVSRARMTQILNLLNVAPEIQLDILNISITSPLGRSLSERRLRRLAAYADWSLQRCEWQEIVSCQASR